MKVFAIRGAITVAENTEQAIGEASIRLMEEIIDRNDLRVADVVSIIISSTQDLDAMYPAKAIRMAGFENTPLFSCLEPAIVNSLKRCIRVLVTINEEDTFKAKHVYLGDSKVLRPDLTKE